MMSRVKFEKKSIVIDGVPRQILSGAVHYFRVPEELWEDRLRKAAQCGLNCIETYCCWNLHEPEEGRFDFSGMLNLGKFIRTAAEQGLYVIVRPGPYICAEWDNGGIPAWLMTRPGIEFRRMNTPYLEAVERYYKAVLPILAELQYDAGGPVIAVQVENEYGSYGHDKEYLATLRRFCREGGITVPLFTADGAADLCIVGGHCRKNSGYSQRTKAHKSIHRLQLVLLFQKSQRAFRIVLLINSHIVNQHFRTALRQSRYAFRIVYAGEIPSDGHIQQ